MLDFTGELNRYAVARATARDRAAVAACRDVVEGIMGQFLQLDLRNSMLRKKYDALKYTLRKMVRALLFRGLFGAARRTHAVLLLLYAAPPPPTDPPPPPKTHTHCRRRTRCTS